MKEKKNRLLIALICVFVVSLGLTLAVGFSNVEQPKLFIQSMTPLYDEGSTVVVNDDGVLFNDRDQEVKYKVVIENPQNYDVKVSDINLSTPTEEFLEYEIENLNVDDVVKANSTKEIVVDFKTVKKDGWGRNFSDELTADISFAKVAKKEDEKPVPEPEVEEESKEEQKEEIKQEIKEEDKQEEVKEELKEEVENIPEVEEQVEVSAPVATTEEVKETFTLIETFEIEEDEIVFTEIQNIVDKQMIDVWIYSNPIYLGRFEVEVKDGKTKILGLSEALEKHNIEVGKHSLVLQSETGEKIGYVEVRINNSKIENPKVEIELPKEDVVNKVEDNVKENVDKQQLTEDEKSNNILLVILVIVTGATGVAIGVIVVKNGKTKTIILLLALCPLLTVVDAEEVIDLTFTFNISFESQNVMKPSGCDFDYDEGLINCEDYWLYAIHIKNIYIQNDISPIENIKHEFDVSNQGNGRVKAFLVENISDDICWDDWHENSVNCYDLYLQADGLIYFNEDSSYYFSKMINLELINNLFNVDTSEVSNMSNMFYETGYYSDKFNFDLSEFDTGKVTNMESMFRNMCYFCDSVNLDVSNFNTKNVTNMNSMFSGVGENQGGLNTSITIRNSNVIDFDYMFDSAAAYGENKIFVNYTSKTSELVDKMINTKSKRSNVEKGALVVVDDENVVVDKLIPFEIGDEININKEKFYVIRQTDDEITMLAKYNLSDTTFKQTEENVYFSFSNGSGWDYKDGPNEIDIQKFDGPVKTYVNEYVSYLQENLGDKSVTGTLITLKELKELGCTIEETYEFTSSSSLGCKSSKYSWLNEGEFFTRSAVTDHLIGIWILFEGSLGYDYYSGEYSIRPVITVSKETLINYTK